MDDFAFRGITMATENSGLVAGTTTTYTTATFDFCIDGNAYTKSAVTNAATPTTDGNTAAAFVPLLANQGCSFLFLVNASGTVSVVQGKVRTLSGDADGANATFSTGLSGYPRVPDNICPFGKVIVRVGASGSTWTMGSSNLSSVSNVAFKFTPVMTLGSSPPAI